MEADTAMLCSHGDVEGGLEDASCLQGDRGPQPQISDLCGGVLSVRSAQHQASHS